MSKIKNTLQLRNGYVEIIIEKPNEYKHICYVDTEDILLIKGTVRVSNTGYAITNNGSVAHIIMKHKSSYELVVDHINGNTLDNRKSNLRIVTQSDNARNRHSFVRNNTSKVGIAFRQNGNYKYYRCSVSDKSKIHANTGNKIRYTKQFNINKLGKEKAFDLANQWLNQMKIEHGYYVDSGSTTIPKGSTAKWLEMGDPDLRDERVKI